MSRYQVSLLKSYDQPGWDEGVICLQAAFKGKPLGDLIQSKLPSEASKAVRTGGGLLILTDQESGSVVAAATLELGQGTSVKEEFDAITNDDSDASRLQKFLAFSQAPMDYLSFIGVLPKKQRKGHGSFLIRRAVATLRAGGTPFASLSLETVKIGMEVARSQFHYYHKFDHGTHDPPEYGTKSGLHEFTFTWSDISYDSKQLCECDLTDKSA